MSEPVLLIEKSEGIATLTLNRPQAMNALSRQLRAAIVSAFDQLREQQDVDVVILTGAGRAFCAGLDLKELGGESGGGSDVGDAVSGTTMVRALAQFDRPIIGAINGFAITGGFELALACDVLIASTAARFADTHARVGILPGWGLSQKLSRAIGIYRAKELSLSGNYLSAEQAAEWGLVNRVVEPAELLPACRALAVGHAVVRARGDACLQAADRRRLRGDVRRRPADRGDGVARARRRPDAGGDRRPPRRGAGARPRPIERGGERPIGQQPVEKVETPFDKHVLSKSSSGRAGRALERQGPSTAHAELVEACPGFFSGC